MHANGENTIIDTNGETRLQFRELHGIGMERGKSEANVSKGGRHRHKKKALLCCEAEEVRGDQKTFAVSNLILPRCEDLRQDQSRNFARLL